MTSLDPTVAAEQLYSALAIIDAHLAEGGTLEGPTRSLIECSAGRFGRALRPSAFARRRVEQLAVAALDQNVEQLQMLAGVLAQKARLWESENNLPEARDMRAVRP